MALKTMSLGGEIDARRGLVAIGLEIAVGKHDALGHAFRARGEEDDGRRIGIGIAIVAELRKAVCGNEPAKRP